MADKADKKVPALRVSQLDSNELDSEIVGLVKLQLSKLFKYQQSNALVSYEPEINVLIKLLIWRFSVFARGATIGQQILNLKYSNEFTSDQWMSRRQKILYASILIGCPWIKERLADIVKVFGLLKWKSQIRKSVQWLETGLSAAALMNFLIFLQNGIYQTITERILGVRSVFPNKQQVRQVTFEFMTRELLWHGFSEFLFFVLPLVNFQRIRNFMLRRILPGPRSDAAVQRSSILECAVCGDTPISPQEIGCSHVFCYYCVHSNYKADPGFCCPLCGMNIPAPDCIKPLRYVISSG